MKNEKDIFTKIESQLASRSADRIHVKNDQCNKNLILLSECDYGVIRNGGRRGSNYGPKSILANLRKMCAHKVNTISVESIRSKTCEENFNAQQLEDTQKISQALQSFSSKNIWHLGGGHDHIYPLLKSIEKDNDKICIINIDAHLDTRIDELYHSGTPFRQFSNETNCEVILYQLGIHKFANVQQNYEPLKRGSMKVYTPLQIQKESSNFTNMNSFLDKEIVIPDGFTVILSLDCDAIDSSSMEAVSAVNHDGLSLNTIRSIFSWYFSLAQERNYVGIYEYNPLFDNLSSKGARAVSSLMENYF
ncbi:arginase family protein [Halobacteriovorax sp. HLS]|uniref:arginase family protein n=1 Tax=Halobacteriovorax sp. HLS TaxID=2234000 RepID=UPI000FDAE97C|nr:arginase family protein [Halobacteriovorax sp. HLS]